ncbi:MAG: HD-GYP domain-containing protein [Bacillota bacterium]
MDDWILAHHEWWNGKGYPLGLKGEEIPLECRLLALVDAYDSMTSDRTYRGTMQNGEAVAEIRRCAGTQSDPYLAEVFPQLLENRTRDADSARRDGQSPKPKAP